MDNKQIGKASVVFGTIGLVSFLLFIGRLIVMKYAVSWYSVIIVDYIFIFIFYTAWIFDVLGIFFGIKGLKLEEKMLARTGIILSVLGLFEYMLLYFILASTFGMI